MAKTPPFLLIQTMLKMGISPPKPNRVPYPENWGQLSSDEKYEIYRDAYISTEGRNFDTPEAEKTYQRRAIRWTDMIELKEPDQVPNHAMPDTFLAKYEGLSGKDLWYNSRKACKATFHFREVFDFEHAIRPACWPGRALDLMNLQVAQWPGSVHSERALREDQAFQYIEGEYMPPEEYDHLIADPSEYILTSFAPSICPGLSGFKKFPSLATPISVATMMGFLMGFEMGPVKKTIKKISKASKYLLQDMAPIMITAMKLTARYGTPSTLGGVTIAPFDLIGDTMRGTKGILTDMFRRPEKLIAACESVIPMCLRMALEMASIGGPPFVMIPLHKGADSFMSVKQYEKFYWPSFRKLLLGIIDAGLIPISFAEGSYNERLDFIADKGDLPAGKTSWMFDQTDMAVAKKKIGHICSIGGNVPSSLFCASSVKEMNDYCKKLIEDCAPGGGFFLAPGAPLMDAREDTLKAYLGATKKYGVYSTAEK